MRTNVERRYYNCIAVFSPRIVYRPHKATYEISTPVETCGKIMYEASCFKMQNVKIRMSIVTQPLMMTVKILWTFSMSLFIACITIMQPKISVWLHSRSINFFASLIKCRMKYSDSN